MITSKICRYQLPFIIISSSFILFNANCFLFHPHENNAARSFAKKQVCRQRLVSSDEENCDEHKNQLHDINDFYNHTNASTNRRTILKISTSSMILSYQLPFHTLASIETKDESISKDTNQLLIKISDPQTYSALLYLPSNIAQSLNTNTQDQNMSSTKYPLLLVLHGAAKNEEDIWNLADIRGEHSGLPPSLISAGVAPKELTDNFIVASPYVNNKDGKVQTFYTEPRSKILNFVTYLTTSSQISPFIDTDRIFILGFSDGATVAIELLTTKKFKAGIIAAYGFTGALPSAALERLTNIPIWVFHSKDDVIFPVECSDKLIQSLRAANKVKMSSSPESAVDNEGKDIIRYSRFEKDQEGFTGRVRGHSTGITASKLPETYSWLLSW